MIKEALQYVNSLVPANLLDIGTRKYADKSLIPIQEPIPTDIDVSTLRGFVDLVDEKVEGFGDGVLIHVVSFAQVKLIEKTSDQWGRRKAYIEAGLPDTKSFQFGTFMDHENFVIGLQAQFTEAGDREYLLKLASNLTNEQVATSSDDGISQQVGVRAGVVLKSTETVKSRVSLAPFRTFREIEQPASEFVFRVKQNGTGVPQLALFEADGGKWKIDAMENIGRYLRSAVKDISVIV